MKVGDLVKPNLRVWKMRQRKGQLGIVLELYNDLGYTPHCLVQWPDESRRLTCNKYVKVVI